jgi:hypothetical protein
VGLLAQYAGAGNDLLFGLSARAKYWWVTPGAGRPARVGVQGGIGFVRADIEDSNTGVADVYGSFPMPAYYERVTLRVKLGKKISH